MLRRAVLLLAACGLLAATAAPADAGTYRVYGCKMPHGRSAPIDGWVSGSTGGAPDSAFNNCPSGGYFGVRFSQAWLGGWSAWRRFEVPAGSGLVTERMLLRRAASMGFGSGSDNKANAFVRIVQGGTVADMCADEVCTFEPGAVWNQDVPANDKLYVLGSGVALTAEVGCEGGSCVKAESTWRAAAHIFRSTAEINDSTPPVLQSPLAGTIAGPGDVSGVATVSFDAGDAGSGVRQVVASLAGAEVARFSPSTNGGKCADAGASLADDYEYLAVQPCPLAQKISFSIDTAKAPDGIQPLKVQVIDAAGTAGTLIDQSISVRNTPAPIGPGGPKANVIKGATPVPAGAKLTLAKSSRGELRADFGKSRTVSGTLTDSAGQPVADASVAVSRRLRLAGAQWEPAGAVETDAQGRFTLKTEVRASRLLRFTAGASEVTARLGALAKIDVKATKSVRRGKQITVSGKVSLEALPKRGVRVEMQSRWSGNWRTIDVVKTGKTGSFSWKYRVVRATGTLPFRVRLVPTGDVAAEGGTSRVVSVKVR